MPADASEDTVKAAEASEISSMDMGVADGPDAASALDAQVDAPDAPTASDAERATPDSAAADEEDADAAVISAEAGSPSCAPGGGGMTNCGPGGSGSESCCVTLPVEGGTFYRTYAESDVDDGGDADPATLSGFRLDKYDVTVGRFRQFVSAVLPATGGLGWLPTQGSGKQGFLNGGHGVTDSSNPGMYELGWDSSWNSDVAPTSLNLTCDSAYATWTPAAETNENRPINCVNWYEAYAFCIWDGGFLPTEPQWEYTAAGGDQQREYPWGPSLPPTGVVEQYAIFGNSSGDCYFPSGMLTRCVGVTSIAPVGTATLGVSRWGQLDTVGEVFVWVLDGYNFLYLSPCMDCAYLGATPDRVARGGSFSTSSLLLQVTTRGSNAPTHRYNNFGIRCARAPQ